MCRKSKQLGEQLADLHVHNKRLLEKLNKEQQTVGNSPFNLTLARANVDRCTKICHPLAMTTLNSIQLSNFE